MNAQDLEFVERSISEPIRLSLQGWAIVENPTDEDWTGVKMGLISGRPISFKMDLYDPLFVPRPTVEPELFASLRPPTYNGGFGRMPRELNKVDDAAKDLTNEDPGLESNLERTLGASGTTKKLLLRAGGGNDGSERAPSVRAKELEKALAARIATGSIDNAATGSSLGDFFQYTIDHPVSLARQKSALLPIVGKEVEGSRVSIYNPAVQAKHPLLGLRLKNTSVRSRRDRTGHDVAAPENVRMRGPGAPNESVEASHPVGESQVSRCLHLSFWPSCF